MRKKHKTTEEKEIIFVGISFFLVLFGFAAMITGLVLENGYYVFFGAVFNMIICLLHTHTNF